MTFNWTIIIFIIVALVAADKLLTIANINAVSKNFPKVDPLSIEKNPVAREFYKQHGLAWGSITFGIFSILLFIAALFLIHWTLKSFGVTNSLSISLYCIMIYYGFVIMNNTYFLLKFSKVIS